MGDVVSLTTQFAPVGCTGTLAVFGVPSGRIVPVGISEDPGNSGGFVLPIVIGGLLDFSAEGFPGDVSDEPVRPGCSGEIRAEPRAFSESNPIAVLDHFAGWHRSRRRCERLESTTPVRQQSHLRIEHKRYRPKE